MGGNRRPSEGDLPGGRGVNTPMLTPVDSCQLPNATATVIPCVVRPTSQAQKGGGHYDSKHAATRRRHQARHGHRAGRASPEQLTPEHSRSPRCRPPRSGRAGISGNSWIPAGESAPAQPTRQNCSSPSLSLMRSGSPAIPCQRTEYSGRVNAGMIWLSVRHFAEDLLIEVFDTRRQPARSHGCCRGCGKRQRIASRRRAEQGMVVLLPARLAARLSTASSRYLMPQRLPTSPRPVRDWIRHGPGHDRTRQDN